MTFGIQKILEIPLQDDYIRVWGKMQLFTEDHVLAMLRTPPDTTGDTVYRVLGDGTIESLYPDDDMGLQTEQIMTVIDSSGIKSVSINGFGECCPRTNSGTIYYYDGQEFKVLRDFFSTINNPNNDNNYGRAIICPGDDAVIFQGDQGGFWNKIVKLSTIESSSNNADITSEVRHFTVYSTDKATYGVHNMLFVNGDYIYGITGRHVDPPNIPLRIWRISIDDLLSVNDGESIESKPTFEILGEYQDYRLFGVNLGQGATYATLTSGDIFTTFARIGYPDGTIKMSFINLIDGTIDYSGISIDPATTNHYDPSPWASFQMQFAVLRFDGYIEFRAANGGIVNTVQFGDLNNYKYTDSQGRTFLAIAMTDSLIFAIRNAQPNKYLEVWAYTTNNHIPRLVVDDNLYLKVYDIAAGEYVNANIRVSKGRCVAMGDVQANNELVSVPPDGVHISDILSEGEYASIKITAVP